ncbi:MICAL-like protein 1 isoform X2 [Anneissia japonica]|uniref:MICAL-like protein 1 isoform X2 n=1 Tax=Anneissia japonica TaxID=1529436 RepID=UPI001425982B|nr:MICAL-like protein 1 isoform X2 [Anneissia japonica]
MALRGAKALQAWCQQVTEGYEDVKIENMTKSWRDGLAFCAIIHNYRPELIDFDALSKENIRENNALAFEVAERELGIPALLDPEDMASMLIPDRLSILTYVSQYYNYFHGKSPAKKRPKGGGIANIGKKREKSVAKDPSEPPRKISTMGDKCISCGKKVYLMERLVIESKLFHRACFKCKTCKATLRSGTYKKTTNSAEFECLHHGNDIWKIRANFSERASVKTTPKPVAVSGGEDIWQSQSAKPVKMEIVEAPVEEFKEPAKEDDPWASRIDLIPNQKESPKIPRRQQKPDPAGKPDLVQKPVGGVKLPTVSLHPHLLAAQTSRERFQGTDDTRKGLMKSLAAVRSDYDSSSFGSKDSLSSTSSRENMTSSSEILTPPPRQKSTPKAVKDSPFITNQGSPSNLEAPPRKKGGLKSPLAMKKTEKPAETDDNVKQNSSKTIETSVVSVVEKEVTPADGIQRGEDKSKKVHETEENKKKEYEKDNEKDKDDMEGVEVDEKGKLDLEEKGKVDEKNSEKDVKNEPTNQTSSEGEDSTKNVTKIEVGESKTEIEITVAENDNYDEDKNPFAESGDSDYSGDNPFGEVDSDEDYDESMNPFKDEEEHKEYDEGVNPFTGSPPKNFPPRTPPSKTQENSGVSYSVKSRTDILKEMQRDRSTLKQKKRRAPPRPKAPPGQSPGAAGGLTPPPRQAKKKDRKAPPPPKAGDDGQLEFQKLQQKMLQGKDNGNIRPASPSQLRVNQNGINRTPGGTPDIARKRKSQKTFKAPPPPLIKREVEKHHVDTLVIQRELKEIEIKQNDLERKGVKLEEKLREQMNDGANDEGLLIEWFELVNNKNQLVRREGELVALAQSQELEKKHAEIEFDLRRIMLKQEHEKTDADAIEEQRLLDLLVDVVTKRSEVVDRLENDRIREEQEDENIRVMMRESGLSKDPVTSQKVKNKKEKKEKRKSKGILW